MRHRAVHEASSPLTYPRGGLVQGSKSQTLSAQVAQTLLVSGAGTHSQKTVSMETGTLEMLRAIAPRGWAADRNISM